MDYTSDFYQTLAHNFGMKKSTGIDHLLRVKEKGKMLDLISDILVAEQALIGSHVSCFVL